MTGNGHAQRIVQKLWNYCNVLRDDGSPTATTSGSSPTSSSFGIIFRKAQNKIQDPAKLRRLIVDLINREQWTVMSADVKGDAYEGLLERNAQDTKGGAGQFFTPRPQIEAMDE